MVFPPSNGKINKAVSTHYMAIAFPENKWETVVPSTVSQCYCISDFSVPLRYALFILPQTICETFGKLVSVGVSVIAWVKLDDNFTS